MADLSGVYWGKGFRYFHEMLHDAYTPEPDGFPEPFLMGWRHARDLNYRRNFGKFSDLGFDDCPDESPGKSRRVVRVRSYGEHRC